MASSASVSTSFLDGNCLTTGLYSSKCHLKTFLQVKVKVVLWPTASRPVCLGVKHNLWPKTRFLLLSDTCRFADVGRPLWWGDGSVVCNCCWSSPAQSFSDLSPARPMTIFYCLKFETPPTWRAWSLYLYSPGTGWPS
jgi:hypothetical protein